MCSYITSYNCDTSVAACINNIAIRRLIKYTNLKNQHFEYNRCCFFRRSAIYLNYCWFPHFISHAFYFVISMYLNISLTRHYKTAHITTKNIKSHFRNQISRGLSVKHYNDIIMGAMATQIISLTNVYSTVIQAQVKENIKAPRHWPMCEEFTGDRWIPLTKG